MKAYDSTQNWILDCLKGSELLYGRWSVRAIEYDEISFESLEKLLKIINSNKPVTVASGDCCLPLFPIAGLMLGYHFAEEKSNKIVYAYTQDQTIYQTIVSLRAKSCLTDPICKFFPVPFLKPHIKTIKKDIKPRGSIRHPYLFFSNTIDNIIIGEIVDAGLDPKVFLLDGRTLSPSDVEKIKLLMEKFKKSVFILLSPSPYQIIPGFPPAQRSISGFGEIVNANHGIPLLVNKKIVNFSLSSSPIDYDLKECTSTLQNLGRLGERTSRDFLSQTWALYRLLLSLPIQPKDLNLAWSKRIGALEHPIAGPLARLKNFVDLAFQEGNGAAPYMNNALIALQMFQEKLDQHNMKEEKLLELIKGEKKITLLVLNNTTASAAKAIFSEINPEISVKYWYEPPIWAPTIEPVIICSPPPVGREWITTVQISPDVTLLLYPIEAALMKKRYSKIGVKKEGRAWKILDEIIKTSPETKEIEDTERGEDPYSIINALSMSAPTEIIIKPSFKGEKSEKIQVLPIELEGYGIYWARRNSKISVLSGSNVRRIDILDLKIGDLLILTRNSPEGDVQEIFIKKFEEKYGKGIVDEVRKWKDELIKFRGDNTLKNKDLTDLLNRNGASLNELQVRNILGDIDIDERQIATWDTPALIKASFRILGKPLESSKISKLNIAITRLRGLHHNAGKALKRLAEASVIFSDESFDIISSDLGITLEDLRKQVVICVVQNILPLQEVGEGIAGTIEINQEAEQ